MSFPVPALRLIQDGLRMSGGYGFVDLFPTSPKRKLILSPPPDTQERLVSPPPAIAAFPADGTSSVPYARMRIDLPDGRVALADVTLQSLVDAVDAIRAGLGGIGALIPSAPPPANLGPGGPAGLGVP